MFITFRESTIDETLLRCNFNDMDKCLIKKMFNIIHDNDVILDI